MSVLTELYNQIGLGKTTLRECKHCGEKDLSQDECPQCGSTEIAQYKL